MSYGRSINEDGASPEVVITGHSPELWSRVVPFPLSGKSAGSGWPVFPVPIPFTPACGFPPFWNCNVDAAENPFLKKQVC